MKPCNKCQLVKPIEEFYLRKRGDRYDACKNCHNKRSAQAVSEWRRKAKATLVVEHGGKCVDCGYIGPPFMYDFDHRDPKMKSFSVAGNGSIQALAKMREEAKKCDLVCSNCHRMRTHIQRCSGCEYCNDIRIG